MVLTEEQLNNFWKKINLPLLNLSGECWEWNAATRGNGYGTFNLNGKMVLSHRIMYQLFNGEIPSDNSYHGMCVLHSCDNTKCVSPYHLSLGSQKENMADRNNKGRQARGELNGRSKLNKSQVAEIRELYQTGNYTQKEIGEMFGVDQISNIVNKKYWKHAI